MMKILYISHLHPPDADTTQNLGGTQTVSTQLLQELRQQPNVSIHPILLKSPTKGIAFRTILFIFWLYQNLPRIIQREKADVILCASMVTASLVVFLGHKVQVPMVTLNHGQDVILPNRFYQKLVRGIFKRISGAISVSKATQQACLDRGLLPEKSIVLPNGINININRNFSKETSRTFIEQQFNIDLTHRYLLLTVGRQVKRKGHAWFIQSVLPHIQSDVIYLVLGDGAEAEDLKRLKQKVPWGDRIILAGKASSHILRHAYDAADLFVMPNIPIPGDMEGFGVVLLEANEARMPVIASRLEGMTDVVQQGVNGYCVEPLNPKAFSEAIDTTLQGDLESLSQSAYNHVIAHYQWQQICPRYINFLTQVIQSQITPQASGQ